MAIHAHSIPMPVDNLPAGQVCATVPQTPAMAAFELPETGDLKCGHMPTHPLNADLRSVDLFPGSGEKPKLPAPAPLPSLTAAFCRRRAIFGAVEVEPETERALVASDLALAQMWHARRALEGALEHGASLLAALGLPRLVEPGFVPIDPTTAGDAIEAAIAALDAMDSPDADIEDGHDAEHDTSDAELDLGWNEKISQLALGQPSDDSDATALERHGRGFIRSGPEDAEPSLGAPEPYIGHHVAMLVDQTYWAGGGCDDLELGDDNGIGDNDGLQEQLAGTRLIPTLAWSVGGYVG